MNSKLNRLLASLLVLTTNSFGAGININGGTCSNDCQPCCDKVTGFVGPPHLNSLGWGVSLGLARYPKPTSLTPFGQAAFEKNGNLPDFNQLFGRYFSSDPLQQNQIRLELSQTQLSAATFHPSCLFLQSEARFETLKKPAAGGFPEYIHQIVTDDAFTLIDVLPDSGWRLRVWRRPQQLPTKSLDGFYNTANFVDPKKATPLTDVIFKRPDGSSGNNTLIYIQKETTGVLPGTRIITNKIVQTLAPASGKPLTVVSELFEGEGTTGELLSDETLTYPVTERGTKAWDYTIVRVTRTSSVNENGTNASLTTTAKTREDYDDFSTTAIGGQLGMKRLVSKTEAFEVSGQTPQTTTYTYINTPTNPATHGRLRSTVNPDGSWTFSEYAISSSTTVPIITEYSGWKDLEYTGPEDLTMAQRNAARKTVTTITANQALVETTVAGQLVSQSRTTLGVDSGVPFTTAEKWDGSAWHVTKTAYYPDNAPAPATGRIKWIENSDGTLAAYLYAIDDGQLVTTVSTGAGSLAAVIAGLAKGDTSGITAGTEVVTTHNLGNFPISEITKDIASGLVTEQWVTDLSYNGGTDQLGRPIKRIYGSPLDNDYDISQYACCGLEFSRDRMGATTTYFRDGLKRVYMVETKASEASPVVKTFTTITFNPNNDLTTTQTRSIGDGPSFFLGSRTASLDGLTRTTTGLSPKSNNIADRPVTTTITTHSAAGDTVTTTHADVSTSITAYYLDGRTKSTKITTTGTTPITIAPLTSYDYAPHEINGGGIQTTVTQSDSSLASPTLLSSVSSFDDLAGRTFRTESPGYNGAILVSETTFDARGRATGQSSTGKPATLRVLNAIGEATEVWTDSNGDAAFDNNLVNGIKDSVSLMKSDYVTEDGHICRRTQSWIRNDSDTDILLSTTFSAVDGTYRKSVPLAGTGPITVTTATRPLNGNSSSQTRTYPGSDLTSPSLLSSVSTTLSADGTTTTTQTNKGTAGNILTTSSQTVDIQGRTNTVVGERGITTTYSDFTDAGQPLGVTSQGTYTKNTLDSQGRVTTSVTKKTSDSTTLATIHTAYSYATDGTLVTVRYGTNTYPTLTKQNIQGRTVELRTFRESNLAFAPTANTTGGDKTIWTYESATGLLLTKTDADTQPVNYTYTPDGKLLTRTWARGIVTTYGHTPAGQVKSVVYTKEPAGQETPDVSITYNRLGQRNAVSSFLSSVFQSSVSYSYDPATLAPDKEIITYKLPGQDPFIRILDRTAPTLGRASGWDLGSPGTVLDSNGMPNVVDIKNTAIYDYSTTTGRLESVSGNSSGTFSYGYETSSSLIKTVTRPGLLTGQPALRVTNIWEPTRNVLWTKANELVIGNTATDVSSITYTVNELGQRKQAARTRNGAASNGTTWGYDDLGQVTSADDTRMADAADRAYAYDTIGNRLTSATGTYTTVGQTTTFTPATDSLTEYFGSVSSANPPVLSSPGANLLNQYKAIKTGAATVQPVHDFDGNMETGPLPAAPNSNSTLVWDAENRLISTTVNNVTTSYLYDAQSRRIAILPATGNATLYLYDGWNEIAEYSVTPAVPTTVPPTPTAFDLAKSYLWGLDLSGTLQGAGGVGGLLAVKQGANLFYPSYDGNGNITEYLNSSGGVEARFEYDPFGNTVVNTDSSAQFSYRFSTKPLDPTTGLYYYTYRWYDPLTGRWPSRDPIEEEGGINLYGFVGNDGVDKWDYLGLKAKPVLSTVTLDKKPGYCGEGGWLIRWDIQNPTWTTGTIAQEVTTKGYAEPCENRSGNRGTIDSEFTEFWDVTVSNNGVPNISDMARDLIGRFYLRADPIWKGRCTKGEITFTVSARYYEGVTVTRDPNVRRGAILQAGDLFAIKGIGYKFNQVPGAETSNNVNRKLTLKWDCCDGTYLLTEMR